MFRFHSSMVERPHSIRGGPGFDSRTMQFNIWHLERSTGRNVYIMSQYFFRAIIYRDIISHITITYRYIMYFFRTFKKSTAPYKVHKMGLRPPVHKNLKIFFPCGAIPPPIIMPCGIMPCCCIIIPCCGIIPWGIMPWPCAIIIICGRDLTEV